MRVTFANKFSAHDLLVFIKKTASEKLNELLLKPYLLVSGSFRIAASWAEALRVLCPADAAAISITPLQ